MTFSKTCNYGVRAALYVATKDQQEFVSIREISEKLNISFHFLTKILQTLTQAGIVTSFRGPRGGVALAKSAREISLLDIVQTIDGKSLFTDCILGLNNCGEDKPCPLHNQWSTIRQNIHNILESTSLHQVSLGVNRNGFRLTDLKL
jgi:Rrf2 family iron-sulfur cluster assembly transcriptional regulator